MNQENYSTLMGSLADIPDPRDGRGRRYEWNYLLTLVAASLLAGQKSVRGMAQWAAERCQGVVEALGPKWKTTPSAATFYRVLREIDIEELEMRLSDYQRWLDQTDGVCGSLVSQEGQRLLGQALDGKTLCGASQGDAVVHLVSLVRHESSVVLGQRRVQTKIDERKAATQLLQGGHMRHTVTTVDALHTQTKLAQQILTQGGDYLMVVKKNQPTLYRAIAETFAVMPPTTVADQDFWGYAVCETQEKAHGRLERRRLETITGLNDYLTWPGVAQVLRRTCWRREVKSGKTQTQVHFGITSLYPQQVTVRQLEQLWRWHWTIENGAHYIRDVSWGEDKCGVRSGNAPQALAAFRNALLSLLRLEGWPCIPTAQRHFSAHLQLALRFIGALAS